MENAISARKPASGKVKAGRVLLMVSGIWMLILASVLLIVFALMMVFFTQTKEKADLYIGAYISLFSIPLLALFYILSFMGAVDYVRDKGPFVSSCGFCAIIMLIVMLVELYLDTRSLVKGVYDWVQWVTNLIFLIGTEGLYFIGWNLAKDDFE